MGGNAFDKENPAARLTTEQLLQLSAFIQTRLLGSFAKMQHLYFTDSKTSHGDLDLLCAWDAPIWAREGKASEEDKDAFAQELAEKVGAVKWKTSGCRVGSLEVHLAVPVECLDPLSSDNEAYYQVDLLLCLPEHFDFRLFIGSYGLNSIILGHAVKSIGGKLFLQEEKLVLRHAAIDEVPHIVLILTEDVRELCAWLGLDYARWQQGFVDEETHWRWAVTTSERSEIWWAWRRLAAKHRNGYHPPFELKRRMVEMVRFYAWLQTTDFGPTTAGGMMANNDATVQNESNSSSVSAQVDTSNADDSETTPLLAATASTGQSHTVSDNETPAHSTSSETPQDDNERLRFQPRYRDHQMPSRVPAGTPAAYITRIADLESEIEKPVRWDLDRGALRTLMHWDLRTRYFDLVAVRREERRELLRAQLKTVKAKEEQQKSWRKWFVSRLRRAMRVVLEFCGKSKVE